jgi:hypothetical protein
VYTDLAGDMFLAVFNNPLTMTTDLTIQAQGIKQPDVKREIERTDFEWFCVLKHS